MKAAFLKTFGSPLSIETSPDPVLGTGEVIVDVVAAGVLPYAKEVFSGERRYLLTLPVIPGVGGIGRVRAVGPDATRLQIGDWVLCDPTVRSRDEALTPDITLQGWSARGSGGLRLQEHFQHGAFAEQIRVPTECAVPMGPVASVEEAARWCALTVLLVPYGGWLAAGLQAGETVLVSGATGNYGSAAVAVALAMGAGCVVTPGRNTRVLDDLSRRFGARLRPVHLTGDAQEDQSRMRAAAPGPIDCVLDLLPPAASAATVRTAVMTVRERGRVVLMGGVGMLGGEDLALPYPWIMRNSVTVRGQWMYPREAVGRLVNLVRAGLLSLDHFEVKTFALDAANEAVEYAAAHGGPFRLTTILP